MSPEKIEIGDIVQVDFNCSQHTLCHRATVLYVPCAVGDSWIFKDNDTGDICYVSEGCTLVLIEKGGVEW